MLKYLLLIYISIFQRLLILLTIRFCDKLLLISFRGISHLWLSSYLTNRFQYVKISGNKSNMHMLNKGMPQGSI